MGRKKKRQTGTSSPLFLFTPETITLTLEAMMHFEQPLERVTAQDEKLPFVREQVKQVKAKLNGMKAEAETGHVRVVPFDYNEKVLLVAAIQMYLSDLNMQHATPRQAWEVEQCRKIAAYFAPHRPAEQTEGSSYNERKWLEEEEEEA